MHLDSIASDASIECLSYLELYILSYLATNYHPGSDPDTTSQAMMANHITFNGIFSGVPGEDPLEYIEDIELHGQRCEPLDDEARKKEMQSAFRQGVQGKAKTNWYLTLPPEQRVWDTVRSLFTQHFKILEADVGRRIGACVSNLRRRPVETIERFVARATDLSHRCTDEQMRELCYRLCTHFIVPDAHQDFESDCRVQEQVSNQLFLLGKMSADGVMKDTCDFEDVKECILECICRSGAKQENESRTTMTGDPARPRQSPLSSKKRRKHPLLEAELSSHAADTVRPPQAKIGIPPPRTPERSQPTVRICLHSTPRQGSQNRLLSPLTASRSQQRFGSLLRSPNLSPLPFNKPVAIEFSPWRLPPRRAHGLLSGPSSTPSDISQSGLKATPRRRPNDVANMGGH